MPVLLFAQPPTAIPTDATHYAIAASSADWDSGLATVPDISARLEACFDRVRDSWEALGRRLAETPGGPLAHMPTCSTYASDFAQVAAWALLIDELAEAPETVIVVCADPWLFRQVMGHCDVRTPPPPLVWDRLRRSIRGLVARLRLIGKLALAHLRTAPTRTHHWRGARVLLVYAHPESRADGHDAYFGGLMRDDTALARLVHTDGSARHAQSLSRDGRTASLHAWGRLSWLPALLWTRWRPGEIPSDMPFGWLVARAEIHEAGGASAASTAWQNRCHRAWLDDVKPACVTWPWENHPWERNFVGAARARGTRTVGYQHTVVGRHMYNQSPRTNVDGIDGLPDLILANGPAYRDDLIDAGVPAERIRVAGALRQRIGGSVAYDPDGPVFVGLSNDQRFAAQMMRAVRAAARNGLGPFVVKDHPMCPYQVSPEPGIRLAKGPMGSEGGISRLIYCTGTIGLEGLLSGIPTCRFRPRGFVAMDILPRGMSAEDVDAETLADALSGPGRRMTTDAAAVLAPIDRDVWANALAAPEALRQKDGSAEEVSENP